MKFNMTTAALGIGALLLIMHMAKRKGTVAEGAEKAKTAVTGTEAQAAWWTYAGKWTT